MIKTKFIYMIVFLGIFYTSFFAYAGDQKDWKGVDSCRVLSSHLKLFVQNPDIKTGLDGVQKKTYFIDDGELKLTSVSHFFDYDKEKKIITIIKGPKDPQSGTTDINNIKIIGKIKLPSDFKNVQIRFFQNTTIIIFAEHLDDSGRVETVALFYDLSNDKFAASYYFANTGRMIKIHVQSGKLYLITNSELTVSKAKDFIKKDGNLPSIFPKFSEGLKLGLISDENVSVCKNYKYLYKPSDQMPSFWSIIAINLNDLRNAKEFSHYIGNFSQSEFSETSMYLNIEGDNNNTIVQRFGLEPKINFQSSENISGTLLDGGILTHGLKSAFITVQTSGKFNLYTLTTFDESFNLDETIELYSGSESFDAVEYQGTTVFLKNKDTAIAVAEWGGSGVSTNNPIVLPLKDHHYFMVKDDPLLLLDARDTDNKLHFSLEEKDTNLGEFKSLYTSSYAGNGAFLGNFSWDREQKVLVFTSKLSKTDSNFQGIRVIQLVNNGKIKEIMARAYKDAEFRGLDHFKEFTYAITEKLIDMFIPTEPSILRVLSR